MLKSRVYECPQCAHYFDSLIDDREREAGTSCPECSSLCSKADERVSAPQVLTASWPMGRRTETAKKLIEAAKLESESFNMKPKDRANHTKEVKKLRSAKK